MRGEHKTKVKRGRRAAQAGASCAATASRSPRSTTASRLPARARCCSCTACATWPGAWTRSRSSSATASASSRSTCAATATATTSATTRSPHFILDVRAAVRGLGLERPVLVGHSFGGEVAAQYAGLFPEVLGALVLIEGLGPPPWEGEGSREAGVFWARSMVEQLDAIDPEGRRLADLDEATRAHPRTATPRLEPKRARFLAEQGVRPHPAGGLRWKWDPFLVTTWGSFNFGQMEQMWSRIRVPTLAANGARSGEFWRRDLGRAKRGGEIEAYLAPDELQRRLGLLSRTWSASRSRARATWCTSTSRTRLNLAIDAFLRRRLESLGMELGTRPWWMNALFAFCLFMTFAYMPFDVFWKPVETDQEVWFGFLLHGWAAKATEPLHWAIYAAGAYGFWKMRSLDAPVGRAVHGAGRDRDAGVGAHRSARRRPRARVRACRRSSPSGRWPGCSWRSRAHFTTRAG